MIDCRDCKHSVRGYHDTLCTRFKDVRSIDWMRDDRGECKRAALMFEAKEPKKELKQWHPY